VTRYRDAALGDARRAYDTYLSNFRGMQGEYPKVLNAQRSYFELQEEYNDALRDGWRAVAELESLLLLGTAGDRGD
jgi:outer membrane protein TolC